MNTRNLLPYLILLLIVPVGRSDGQDTAPPVELQPPTNALALDHYSLALRMGFNIKADFRTGFGPSSPIAAPGIHQVDRTYDDGFNKVDVTHNAGGYTAYWSYQAASQYDPNANTITMHSASGTVAESRYEDPHLGLEATYNRELGRRPNLRWGFEAAFNYLLVGIHEPGVRPATGTITSDTYAVPQGYPVPPPGYPGDYFASAGDPLLFDTPAGRGLSALTATSTGERNFKADVFGWRLGPYLDLPLADTISLHFSGGLAVALVTSDFEFNEAVTYLEPGSAADYRTVLAHGSSTHDDFLAGGYVSGLASLSLSKNWDVFGGVQFQSLGHYTHQDGNSQARLDLSESMFVVIGATYTF